MPTIERGLTTDQVAERRAQYGFNEIPERKKSVIIQFFKQFQDVMVYILLAAVAVSLAVPYIKEGVIHQDEIINASVILAIVLLNAILGFVQEQRAENAIALLRQLSAPQVKVRRNGQTQIIPSREIVPGDVMLIEAGDKISADGYLMEASSLQVNESSLTGESVPVSKSAKSKGGEKEVYSVLAGTVVTIGSGTVIVQSIALQTEIGKVTSLVMASETPMTPLQKRLKALSVRLGMIVLAICVLLFGVGLLQGRPVMDLFFIMVSLAVAAVPEGLPAIVTICLAIGVQRMLKKNALIRRLDAIETLGNVNVICADKTGTMTENNMTVVKNWVPDAKDEDLLIRIAASCNRSELPDIGDPTETALLVEARAKGIERLPIVEEPVPFTSEAKYMATVHQVDKEQHTYYKGAPEVIVEKCKGKAHADVLEHNMEMAKTGLRVLAMAVDEGDGIRFVGLMGMMDPARKGVKEAISKAKTAGIRTIMITGDNAITAATIAGMVGLETDGVIEGKQLETMDAQTLTKRLQHVSVFARVRPEHKVKILESLQSSGSIVAMSGDGVNDAPALKRAHVGVAMGLKGTDIAREAGAMILTDDNYATIVEAVAEGRRIYDNIRKFIVFLLRTNIGEVFLIASSIIVGAQLPLLPLHILWINLVTDSLPALALAAEQGGKNVMRRPPRPVKQNILEGELSLTIVAGILNAGVVLWLYQYILATYDDLILARTTAMTTTIIFQFFLAFSTRIRHTVFERNPFQNKWLILAVAASLGLHLLLLATPLSRFFFVTMLPPGIWGWVLGCTAGAFVVFEICKLVRNRMSGKQAE